jgi:hypothetical protein
VKIQHPVNESALESGPESSEHWKTRSGNFGAAGQVKQAEGFPQLPVGPGCEGVLAWFPPDADDLILVFTPLRNLGKRNVRSGEENFLRFGFYLSHCRIQPGNLVPNLSHTKDQRLSIAPLPLEISDLPGYLISFRLECIRRRHRCTPNLVQDKDTVYHCRDFGITAPRQACPNGFGILPNFFHIQHGLAAWRNERGIIAVRTCVKTEKQGSLLQIDLQWLNLTIIAATLSIKPDLVPSPDHIQRSQSDGHGGIRHIQEGIGRSRAEFIESRISKRDNPCSRGNP